MISEKTFLEGRAKKVALNNARDKTIEREDTFKGFLNQSKNTLRSIRKSKIFENFLHGSENNEELVTDLFLSFAEANPDFMLLRYIDSDGREKIRIERNKIGAPAQISVKDQLQNQSKKYFFTKSTTKRLDEVSCVRLGNCTKKNTQKVEIMRFFS